MKHPKTKQDWLELKQWAEGEIKEWSKFLLKVEGEIKKLK